MFYLLSFLSVFNILSSSCGKKEENYKTVTVRTLGSDKQETLKREELIKRITQSNKMPAN